MKVKTDHYNLDHKRTYELSRLLTPCEYPGDYRDDGERALALAQATAERFGRLAEMLVEKGLFTLEEAADAAGYSYSLTEVK
jgi:hypothetical protein